MTFEWKSNEDCTDLTCELPDGYYLRVEQMDKHSWFWRLVFQPKAFLKSPPKNETSLIDAMRAAQTAYLEHVKAPTP